MGRAAKDEAVARRVSAGTMGSQGVMAAGVLVGFYACETLDRLVRVRPPDEGHVPKAAQVDCPCGDRHRTKITWRALRDDEDQAAEVAV